MKSKIMKLAWIMYKESNEKPWLFPMTFAESLKAAWKKSWMFKA